MDIKYFNNQKEKLEAPLMAWKQNTDLNELQSADSIRQYQLISFLLAWRNDKKVKVELSTKTHARQFLAMRLAGKNNV